MTFAWFCNGIIVGSFFGYMFGFVHGYKKAAKENEMTTIPQRLREIARSVHEMEYGQPNALADSLHAIAAELEAPAADAVPVVATIESKGGKLELAWCMSEAKTLHDGYHRLVTEEDHIATVSALQARITELERQKEIDVEQGNVSVAHYASVLRQLSDAQARINALEARQLPEGSIPITRQSLAELIQDGYMAGAKRGVETAVTDLLARGWTAPKSSHPDTGKDAP